MGGGMAVADRAQLQAAVRQRSARNWAQLHNRLDNLYRADNPELPTLDPWVVTTAPPAERFVFVNMRKYHEGDTLSEGPTIERITPDGTVLNHQGQRFVLPRQ